MPLFTPPVHQESVSGDRLFARFTMPTGASVVRVGGVFRTQPYPWIGDLDGLTEGVDWFQGGRTYEIDDALAAELSAAGFTVDPLNYSDGRFSYGPFGG